MKVSRAALKKLVKECLIEILQEGVGDLQVKEGADRDNGTHLFNERASANKRMLLTAQSKKPSAALMQAVRQESGGNPMMQSILADTAINSLPVMLANSTPGGEALVPLAGQGVGVAGMVVAQTRPEDLFGEEAVAKWSNLAFMGKPGPKAA